MQSQFQAGTWIQLVKAFLDIVRLDRSLVTNMNHYQDLLCQMHLLGVYTEDALRENPTKVPMFKSKGRLSGWSHIPPIICLTLVVDRQALRKLELVPEAMIGTPALHMQLAIGTNMNMFSSIHAVIGSIEVHGVNENSIINLIEDPLGWSSSSALIVSFMVPS